MTSHSVERLKQLHRTRAQELIGEMEGRVDLPRSQLDGYRTEALRCLLLCAISKSRWHHERLAHIDLRHLELSDLSSIPTMTKADLLANFDDISTDRRITKLRCEDHIASGKLYLDSQWIVLASGGTSGVRAVAISDWEECARAHAAQVRMILRWGKRTGKLGSSFRSAGIYAGSGPHASSQMGSIFGSETSSCYAVTQPIGQIVAGLNRSQPDVLTVYSSFLPRLFDEADVGRLRIKPKVIMPCAEPFFPEYEAGVATRWNSAIIARWGASEAGVIGVGSGFDKGLLIQDDQVILEVVDAQDQPVAAGAPGSGVLVTALFRRALPIIRYKISDRITLRECTPACGSGFRLASYVEGRQEDDFHYPCGTLIHPYVFHSVLVPQRAISEFQVEQTPCGAVVRMVVSSRIDRRAIEREIAAELERSGLRGPQVRVVIVEGIKRSDGGEKLKRFVPLT